MPKTYATKKEREQELLAAIRLGDSDAFTILYDLYAKAIYGSIYRVIGKKDMAEEILQDAFLKVWDKIHTYDPQKGALYTWMFNIARNLTIDKMRSSEYFKISVTDTLDDDEDRIIGKKISEEMDLFTNDILNQLSPQQSMVLDLMYFQGFTSEDISKEFLIPLGTVKSRIRGGLKRLRKIYGIL